MDEKQIQRFVEVVKSKSVNRTAQRLNISQPALSKSLRQLEERLQTRLLQRTSRGVHPTEFGNVFYKRALLIDAEFRRAQEELENMKGSTVAQLALGVTPGPGILDQIIPKVIELVTKARPMLKVTVRSGTISELLPALGRSELDLLFTVLDERTAGASVETKLIFEDRFVIVVNSKHPLLGKRSISLSDLLLYRWVLLEDALPLWTAIERAGQKLKLKARYSPIDSNSVVFIRSIVGDSDLIGILPHYAASAGLKSGIIAIPLERVAESKLLPRLIRPMGLVHSKDSELTPAGRALLRSIMTVCHELKLVGNKARSKPS